MTCLRCEIRDIMLPDKVTHTQTHTDTQTHRHTQRHHGHIPFPMLCALVPQEATLTPPRQVVEDMQLQVSAERKKRAAILESEGSREANINVAEGKKASTILASEARRQEQANTALGEAEALFTVADATARSIERIAQAINQPVRAYIYIYIYIYVCVCINLQISHVPRSDACRCLLFTSDRSGRPRCSVPQGRSAGQSAQQSVCCSFIHSFIHSFIFSLSLSLSLSIRLRWPTPQYVEAFGNLAKQSNTVLLPANTGDPAAMVASVRARA
jgi:hypothetical protein